MSDISPAEALPDLAPYGNVVPAGYQYYEKRITPGETLILPRAVLKWYDLYPLDAAITPAQVAETRAFLAAAVERLRLQNDLGFVILHRAGTVLLLLLTTWRSTNELWEIVYVKGAEQGGSYQPVMPDSGHRGAYCVWELGAVWHERQAWVRFLSSPRDDAAKRAYINDHFSGDI